MLEILGDMLLELGIAVTPAKVALAICALALLGLGVFIVVMVI